MYLCSLEGEVPSLLHLHYNFMLNFLLYYIFDLPLTIFDAAEVKRRRAETRSYCPVTPVTPVCEPHT